MYRQERVQLYCTDPKKESTSPAVYDLMASVKEAVEEQTKPNQTILDMFRREMNKRRVYPAVLIPDKVRERI